MVSCTTVTFTVRSARNLPYVRHFFPSRIQAQITIGSDLQTKKKSPADSRNGLNPVWYFHVRYVLPISKITVENIPVRVRLYSESKMGDRYVGEVHAGLRDLYTGQVAGTRLADDSIDLPLIGRDLAEIGVLNISYSFGETFDMDARDLQKLSRKEGGLTDLASNVVDAIATGLGLTNAGISLANGLQDLQFVE